MLTDRSRTPPEPSPRTPEPSRLKLTKQALDRLTPGAAERFVWDEELRPFAVRIYPTGRKVFMLRLRVDGRQRWFRIGTLGRPWTVDTARAEAMRVLGQGANVEKLRETGSAPTGLRHPIEARELARTGATVAEFAKRYIEEHAELHKAPGTVALNRSLLGLRAGQAAGPKTITGALGKLRVDRITRADVTEFHRSLRETPTRANRALGLLSHLMTTAERWGLRPDGSNPCRHVERFAETRRERFLSGKELARLGAALSAEEKRNRLTPFGLYALRLLVLTGARASEILTLKWDAVDLRDGSVRLVRKGRMGTLRLPGPAVAILSRIPRIDGCLWVIPGKPVGRRRDGQPKEERHLTIWGLESVWQEVRKAAKLEDVRVHDLRHSFASVAVAGGQSLPIIGALLGHTVPATTQRYAHLSADPLRVAADATAATIAAAMEPKRAPENVSPLRRR